MCGVVRCVTVRMCLVRLDVVTTFLVPMLPCACVCVVFTGRFSGWSFSFIILATLSCLVARYDVVSGAVMQHIVGCACVGPLKLYYA